MASLHKLPNCRNWIAAFRLPDGRRTMRSTGTPNRQQAMAVAVQYEGASRLASKDRLSETRARQVIADIYAIKAAEKLPSDSLADYLDTWLQGKGLEVAESSFSEYKKTADELLDFLGERAQKPMDSITVRDAAGFQGRLAKRVSAATCNKFLKIARVAWNSAWRSGIVQDNPFAKIKALKMEKGKRRAFTLPELKRLLAVCDDDWRGLVLAGIYTGQRCSA